MHVCNTPRLTLYGNTVLTMFTDMADRLIQQIKAESQTNGSLRGLLSYLPHEP